MVRLGIIGDTQGRYRVASLLAKVRPQLDPVDEIWHAGDWQEPEVLAGLEALGKPLLVVNGNAPDDPRYPERVRRTVEGLEVGMVHRPPPTGAAWTQACDLVIHGHTHRWRDETVAGVRFVNVASATLGGISGRPTLGILTIEGRRADLLRVEL